MSDLSNPVPEPHGHGTTGTETYGTTGRTTEPGVTGTKPVLRRSGSSSSSSSSEDDGMGGRRKKKGLKEKVKEKLPGGHKTTTTNTGGQTAGYGTTTTGGQTAGYGTTAHTDPENKGFMEKIKEKLPGHQ